MCIHTNYEKQNALYMDLCPICMLEEKEEMCCREDELYELASKAAETGSLEDLQAYLRARRNG